MPKKEKEKALTALRVFRKFIKEEDGVLKADGVISRECYELWLESRKSPPKKPEKTFQRTLSAHLCGVDGRIPFSPAEEKAILLVVRNNKEVWPCFRDSHKGLGASGFRGVGFHERKEEGSSEQHLPPEHSDEPPEKQIRLTSAEHAGEEVFLDYSSVLTAAVYLFARCTADFWLSFFRLMKMKIWALGHFSMSASEVQELESRFNKICAENPDKIVYAISILVDDPKDRFTFVNENTEKLLGKIGAKDGGTIHNFFSNADQFAMMKAGMKAYFNGGDPVKVRVGIDSPLGFKLENVELEIRSYHTLKSAIIVMDALNLIPKVAVTALHSPPHQPDLTGV